MTDSVSQPETTGSPPPSPRRPRRLRRFARNALISFAAIALLGQLFRTFTLYRAKSAVEEIASELDRTDPGWRWGEILGAREGLRDEQNSALRVRSVRKQMSEDEPFGSDWGSRYDNPLTRLDLLGAPTVLDERLLSDLRKALEAAKAALPSARKLADAPDRGVYPIDLSRGFVIRYVDEIRAVATLLEVDSSLLAHEDSPEGALAGIRGLFRVARSVGKPAHALELLMREYVLRVGVRALERVLAQTEPAAEPLLKLQRALEQESRESGRLLVAAVRGERAHGSHNLGLAADEGANLKRVWGEPRWDEAIIEKVHGWLYVEARLRHCQAISLREWTRVVEAASLSRDEQIDALEALRDEFEATEEQLAERDDWRRFAYRTINGQLGIEHHDTFSWVEGAVVAVAAERFRRSEGRWPERLRELVPTYLSEVPTDRFGPGRLKIARRDDGVTIYSVGPDRQDHGGSIDRVETIVRDVAMGADIGFRLWNPDSRRRKAPTEE